MQRLLVAALLVCVASPAMAWSDLPNIAAYSLVSREAVRAGVPAKIAHAVIRQESGYRAHIRGAAGEWGIGQIKCQTARSVGFSGSCSALADAATNLRYSMRYLKLALNRGGVGCAGVSLYQSGIYAPVRCSAYGRKVMAGVR